MAHSPSPGSSAFAAPHTSRGMSQSPPLSQQPLTKKDKRKTMIDQRLKDIAENFTSSRDLHLRTQLNALSREMQFITKAELYTNQLLDDNAEDLSAELSSVPNSVPVEGEARIPLGRLAVKFAENINNEMEKRDAGLIDVDIVYKKQLESLKLDFRFAAEVAESECHALKEAARSRVTSSIQTKKKQIQKEKDQLDTADSSFLMNSHALTAITAPGSPGGIHGNRKTRHTRHRHDNDVMESPELQRRKRKAPMDVENESPGPMLRNASIDAFGTLLWDKGKTAIDTDPPDSLLTVEKYFNSKELATHNRLATNSVAQRWSDSRTKRSYNQGRMVHGELGNGDISDPDHGGNNMSEEEGEADESNNLFAAPLMDRTASHATRSTRINQLELLAHRDNIEDLDEPQRSYGAAVLDASLARSKVAQGKDVEAPMTMGMSAQDISDDLSIMQSLLEDD